MATDKSIRSAVQINGGPALTASKKKKLYERELYIDDNGNLYVGKGIGADAVKVNAAKADSISRGNYYSFTPSSAVFGGMTVDSYMNNKYQISAASTVINNATLSNGSISNATISSPKIEGGTVSEATVNECSFTKVKKMVLTSDCYGSSLPTTGMQPGQIFFLTSK